MVRVWLDYDERKNNIHEKESKNKYNVTVEWNVTSNRWHVKSYHKQ